MGPEDFSTETQGQPSAFQRPRSKEGGLFLRTLFSSNPTRVGYHQSWQESHEPLGRGSELAHVGKLGTEKGKASGFGSGYLAIQHQE